ncbi:MAG: hypothetical protein RL095_1556 [Verrucomicrobiota bacterium]|jgi:DNA-binding FadR family transcriptional regulator
MNSSLSRKTEAELIAYIRSSGLKAGDALPTELELAARFAVSRAVIREALAGLRRAGLCDSRRSRGLRLAEPDLAGSFASILNLPLLGSDQRQTLFQLRVVIEIGLAPLVFLRRREEDLANLEKLVRSEEARPGDLKTAIRVDHEFHARLYEISGNLLAAQLQQILAPFMEENRGYFHPERFEDDSLVSHRDLLRELQVGSMDSFCAAMRRHFDEHLQARHLDDGQAAGRSRISMNLRS